MRAVVSLALTASLAVVTPFPVSAASALGTVEGQVRVDGRALHGVGLSVVHVVSGAVHRVRTDAAGSFTLNVGAGQYVLASDATSGLAVARGPALLVVQPGGVVNAQLDLTAVAGAALQAPATPTAAGTVRFVDQPDCLLAGEHPMIDVILEPAGNIQRARLYFRSPASEFFYSEMQPTGRGGFRGFMPRPTMEANPITFYVAATTTDFAEIRTPELTARVVEKEEDCEGRRVAPIGTPPPGTQFFTLAGSAGSPAGFAAGLAGAVAGGGGLGISTTALLVGAGLAGVTIAAVILSDDDNPSPSPSPLASPSPVPSPSPVAPSPSPTPFPPAPGPRPSPPPTSPFQ